MNDIEQLNDSMLKIRTTGRDDSNADQYNYPYEPTPYCVLERLVNSGYITKKNSLIDYGCGKGRVDFYISYQTRCKSLGIEYDERIYNSAMDNKKTSVCRRADFYHGTAQDYKVNDNQDRFYFFNPFSEEILDSVLGRITESYFENPREMYLFFYYPSDEYIGTLMTNEHMEFVDEISCTDLFEGNNMRERIMIFTVV